MVSLTIQHVSDPTVAGARLDCTPLPVDFSPEGGAHSTMCTAFGTQVARQRGPVSAMAMLVWSATGMVLAYWLPLRLNERALPLLDSFSCGLLFHTSDDTRRLLRRREAVLTTATLVWCAKGLVLAYRLPPGALAEHSAPVILLWLQRMALVERTAMSTLFFQVRWHILRHQLTLGVLCSGHRAVAAAHGACRVHGHVGHLLPVASDVEDLLGG